MKNKISKILIVFFLLFIVLGINNPVLADENCNWTPTSAGSVNCPNNLIYSAIGCTGKVGLYQICCCKKAVTFNTTSDASAKFKLPDYVFQIPIGSLSKLTAIDCSKSSTCEIPWIAQYIAAVYNYGLSIGGIIAVLILMAAGLLWIVSGGDSNKINQAKKMIIGSITGLFLLIGMYVFLGFVNPNLRNLKAISISTIARMDMDDENWGSGVPGFQASAKYCGCISWKNLYQSSTYKTGAAIKNQLGNSPLAPYSDLIAQLSQENNIDPALVLAIWLQDSSYATAGAGKTNKNPGNVRCGSAASGPGWVCVTSSKNGKFKKYNDYATAIKDWYNVVGKGKRLSSSTTIRSLIKTYAPPSDNNNTQGYINFVMGFIDKAHNGKLRSSDGNASALQKCSSINDGC